MTKFETVGVNLQKNAETVAQAERNFLYSCEICCCRGLRIECDKCAIAAYHKQVVSVMAEVEKNNEDKEDELKKFLDGLVSGLA